MKKSAGVGMAALNHVLQNLYLAKKLKNPKFYQELSEDFLRGFQGTQEEPAKRFGKGFFGGLWSPETLATRTEAELQGRGFRNALAKNDISHISDFEKQILDKVMSGNFTEIAQQPEMIAELVNPKGALSALLSSDAGKMLAPEFKNVSNLLSEVYAKGGKVSPNIKKSLQDLTAVWSDPNKSPITAYGGPEFRKHLIPNLPGEFKGSLGEVPEDLWQSGGSLAGSAALAAIDPITALFNAGKNVYADRYFRDYLSRQAPTFARHVGNIDKHLVAEPIKQDFQRGLRANPGDVPQDVLRKVKMYGLNALTQTLQDTSYHTGRALSPLKDVPGALSKIDPRKLVGELQHRGAQGKDIIETVRPMLKDLRKRYAKGRPTPEDVGPDVAGVAVDSWGG